MFDKGTISVVVYALAKMGIYVEELFSAEIYIRETNR